MRTRDRKTGGLEKTSDQAVFYLVSCTRFVGKPHLYSPAPDFGHALIEPRLRRRPPSASMIFCTPIESPDLFGTKRMSLRCTASAIRSTCELAFTESPTRRQEAGPALVRPNLS